MVKKRRNSWSGHMVRRPYDVVAWWHTIKISDIHGWWEDPLKIARVDKAEHNGGTTESRKKYSERYQSEKVLTVAKKERTIEGRSNKSSKSSLAISLIMNNYPFCVFALVRFS